MATIAFFVSPKPPPPKNNGNAPLIDGRKLKKLRKIKGLTQEKIARITGVSRSLIAQIERGSRRPSVWLTRMIANALGIDIKKLKP